MFINVQFGEKRVTPRVRLLEPLDLMKKLYNVDYETIEDTIAFKEEGERFLIRARLWSNCVEDAVKIPFLLHERGYVLLHEMDDSPKRFDGHKKLEYADFAASHAVTCSTETLADELRELNPRVKVFKNQIAELLPERNFEEKDHVNIFFGALNREDSWQDIIPILNKAAKKYKDKLRFMVISDMDFFKSLQTPFKAFAADKKMPTHQLVSYNIYMNELKKADIALLPLKDTPFNRAKSDLKFLESANAGVAVLVSPTVYEKTVKDGETGFIYRSPKEFQAKLNILIKDKAKRIEMARAAHEYVKRERLLINHIEERYDWMREIYQRRDELHSEMVKRLESKFGALPM